MAEESSIYAFDEKEQEVQVIAEMTGLDRNQISMLIGPEYGYDKEEVLNMTMDEVDYILTKEMSYGQMEIYYKHIAPRPLKEYRDEFPRGYFPVFTIKTSGYCSICGYTPDVSLNWTHLTATSGYSGDGCFHPQSGLTDSNINNRCWYAKLLAMDIFGQSSSSGLLYDYYMHGENYGATHPDWAHEGNDMAYYNGAPVISPIKGIVTHSSISNNRVSIYNKDLGITMNFQHLSNVDGLGDLLEGEEVVVGQFLGNQNSGDGHVHVQVCSCNSSTYGCDQVHSGRNLDLTCIQPYTYHQ